MTEDASCAPSKFTSVCETCAQGVVTNFNGVRHDREEDDKDLLLFGSSSQARKGFVQCLCSIPGYNISRSIDLRKSFFCDMFAGALGQDVLAESFLASRHAAQCKDQ